MLLLQAKQAGVANESQQCVADKPRQQLATTAYSEPNDYGLEQSFKLI